MTNEAGLEFEQITKTPENVSCESLSNADERQAALNALERIEKTLYSFCNRPEKPEVFGLPPIDFETIRAALSSPRVPDDAKYHELCKQCWDALGITEYTGKHIVEHIKELKSPRVPVIEGLDEAMSVINKFIRARDAEIDFLPEKSTKNTSEWISHFMHNVNYSLSFNDWMNLDKVRAYAELQKGV